MEMLGGLSLNRAQSAFEKRMPGEPHGNNLFPEHTASHPKLNIDFKTHTMDHKTTSIGKNSILSLKSPKLFIIKKGRRSESNEPRKQSGETIFNSPSDNIDPSLPVPQRKFSTFKDSKSKQLDTEYKAIPEEEKKSESSGNSSQTLKLDSNQGSEETKSINKSDEQKEKLEEHTRDLANFEDSIDTRDRSNSGIILRKGDQIDFDAKLGDVIGEGAYGQVYKALNMDSGQFVAIKHINLKNAHLNRSIDIKGLCQEIEVYQQLEHENIVKYIGAKMEKDSIYIYMEYMCGGSLASLLQQYGPFEEKVIKKFTKQVVLGLDYLHEKGIVHRDVKGGNIMSDGSGNVKLADFGAAKILENIQGFSNLTNSEVCNSIKGSLYWMAPELLNQEKHGRKIDIWSLGCTIIEMATASHPWPNVKSYPELVVAVMTKKCPPIPDNLSDVCLDFIHKCLQFDKKLRPRTKDLLKHPFLADE